MGSPRALRAAILGLLLACLFFPPAGAARNLTLEERIAAQEAIERVYYGHRIGATQSFDEAVPRDVLVRKVRTYLAQSAALDQQWQTPVTADMLRSELRRIAARTRMPERLEELFGALDHDAFLIQECLVRPLLVDRLVRERFAYDRRIHAEALRGAEKIHGELTSGRLEPSAEHAARSVVVLEQRVGTRAIPRSEPGERRDAIELASAEFDRRRALAPSRSGVPGPVSNEREAYAIRVTLEDLADRAVIATYSFPKRTWDDWWSEAGGEFNGTAVEAVASELVPLPAVASADGRECNGDSWNNGILDDLPARRTGHSAVWSGSRMIVWGGVTFGGYSTGTGYVYDPATDTWTATSTVDAPSARTGHVAVWAGDRMVIWGGGGGPWVDYNTGGRYDPVSDTWTPTSVVGAPDARWGATGIWTGDVVVVWGGYATGSLIFNTGGRYDPVTDSWMSTATAGAPAARGSHAAVWTGRGMIVWGGWTDASGYVNTGRIYYPASNSWVNMSTAGAPLPRGHHSAVWADDEMIVWGGLARTSKSGFLAHDYTNTGGRYDPVTNTWSDTSTAGAPEARQDHSAVWTGDEMLVWGGHPGYFDTGGRFDPASNTWAPTSTLGAPEGRQDHTTVWTGNEMIVWGGHTYSGGYRSFSTGGRYDPASDSWTPTYSPGAPSGRGDHTAVWTGNEMIVWGGGFWTGGDGMYIEPVDTGGRYAPVTDSWTPTPLTNAPDPRYQHTAVWTGDYVVVWGGYDFMDELGTGGRYYPVGDVWGPVTLDGAPSPRTGHTAVWTGNEMIVWGGNGSNSGARYDPYGDAWVATSLIGAPEGRSSHTAVWTGNEMLVWGGGGSNTGARYDPDLDRWVATSLTGAPEGRSRHTAVWTGDEMVVWGGGDYYNPDSTGGRYDPVTDSWDSTTIDGAPLGRRSHTALWTGNRMVVWGGNEGFGDLQSGGRYDPYNDAWEATSLDEAPSPRDGHSAVWTGNEMLVWGGFGPHETGGRYDPEGPDDDGDGHGCAIDCDDTNPDAFAVPGEVRGMRFAGDADTFEWNAVVAGDATTYDVVRGLQDELPVGGGPSEVCLVADHTPDGGTSDTVSWTDPGIPAPGGTFWYLVRATNACGRGTYGAGNHGAPRSTEACQ